MKKAIIVRDELYPFYILDTSEMAIKIACGEIVDISDDFYTEYIKVMKDFNAMQDLLRRKSKDNLQYQDPPGTFEGIPDSCNG